MNVRKKPIEPRYEWVITLGPNEVYDLMRELTTERTARTPQTVMDLGALLKRSLGG